MKLFLVQHGSALTRDLDPQRALRITGSDEREVIAYQPGSIACLDSGNNGAWRIEWMIRPELLRG